MSEETNMSKEVKMTYAAAVTLYDLIGKILVDINDQGTGSERTLPFNVQYKLQKAANQLAHDYDLATELRNKLIIENGVEKDGKYTIEDDTKKDNVIKQLKDFYGQVTTHNFIKLTEEEALLGLKDVKFTSQETLLFVAALVEGSEEDIEVEPKTEETPVENSPSI